MRRFRTIVDGTLSVALVVLMAALVVDVLWQVFTRFVLRSPSSYTEELARYLLIWVGLLGAAYATGRNRHLAVDLLPNRLRGLNRVRLERAIQAVIFVFALTALVVGGSRLVFVTFYLGQTSAALQTSIGYVYLVVPLSGLFIMFYAVCAMIDAPLLENPPSADDSSDSSGRPGERTASSGDRPTLDKP
jgi:TRAP-type C4-dicarboxylate transport system permease small subunit